jgi:hypothetical protein
MSMDQSKKGQAASNSRQHFDRDAFWEPVPQMTPERLEAPPSSAKSQASRRDKAARLHGIETISLPGSGATKKRSADELTFELGNNALRSLTAKA